MSDRTRDASKASPSTTVLDPLRPAVVVRRRVYDPAAANQEQHAPRVVSTDDEDDEELDESGPPSSINVGRALASLRADELQRVEELLRADEAAEVEVSAEPPPPPPVAAVPTVRIGKTIPLSELAEKMGVPGTELPATLVARGFYALTAKTVLPRETARVIAGMFGWQVEEAPELDEPPPPAAKSGHHSRLTTKAKAKTKTKTKASTGKTAKAKPARRRVSR